MDMPIQMSHSDVKKAAITTAVSIKDLYPSGQDRPYRLYGVSQGGVLAAYALLSHVDAEVVSLPAQADVFIDDVANQDRCHVVCAENPGIPYFALFDPVDHRWGGDIPTMPWAECLKVSPVTEQEAFEQTIKQMLVHIGEDPNREGLLETPKRTAKAWAHWTSGYGIEPSSVMKVFKDGSEGCDEMVVVKDIPFYSHCEHHMAPFFGTATIAYIPNGKIVGLSKLSRLLQIFARRLQVQERLTNQVVNSLMTELNALGAACQIKARHLCMESRGVEQQGHYTVTNALRGVFKEQPETRAEFLLLAK